MSVDFMAGFVIGLFIGYLFTFGLVLWAVGRCR